MPAGQTPHTVTLYAHHDLVDAVQPGDRCVCLRAYVYACMYVCVRVHVSEVVHFMTHTCHKCNGYTYMVLMTK